MKCFVFVLVLACFDLFFCFFFTFLGLVNFTITQTQTKLFEITDSTPFEEMIIAATELWAIKEFVDAFVASPLRHDMDAVL
jgi:hypothetical protein